VVARPRHGTSLGTGRSLRHGTDSCAIGNFSDDAVVHWPTQRKAHTIDIAVGTYLEVTDRGLQHDGMPVAGRSRRETRGMDYRPPLVWSGR
jgi:hypothetical protein